MKRFRWNWGAAALAAGLAGCGGGGEPGDGGTDALPSESRVTALATRPGTVAQRYRVVNLDLAGATAEEVFRLGINAAGQLIGTAVDASGASVAFRYDPKAAVPLQRLDLSAFPGEIGALQINAKGQAVFNVRGEATQPVFVDASGRARAIPPLAAGGSSRAFGLNAQGLVVGSSGDQGFAWTPSGGTVNASPPGSQFVRLEDVNDKGVALGRGGFVGGTGNNYLWSAATGAVDNSAFTQMIAQRLNNAGVLAGFSALNLARAQAGVVSVLPAFTPFGVDDFNERGDIIAFTPEGDGLATFLVWLGDGTLIRPGRLDALEAQSSARAISNHRIVVGSSTTSVQDGQEDVRAFAWSPASGFVNLESRIPSDLEDLELFEGVAVNDAGQIVVDSSAGLLLLVPDDGAPLAAAAVSTIRGPKVAPVEHRVTLLAGFKDVNAEDTHTARWSWGDGSTSVGGVRVRKGKGVTTGVHRYAEPGVYTVSLTVTDSTGRPATSSRSLVVFEADGGFVHGSGWLPSPRGACRADPSLSGRASFDFVSKAARSHADAKGKARFVFRAPGASFTSTELDEPRVRGASAQYQGTGRYNGQPGYSFALTASDGRGQDSDRLRLRVWHRDAKLGRDVIDYDNQLGAQAGPGVEVAIGGGRIVVQQ